MGDIRESTDDDPSEHIVVLFGVNKTKSEKRLNCACKCVFDVRTAGEKHRKMCHKF